jgi:hypothetical protein
MAITFTVGKDDLRRTAWQERPSAALEPGAIRLRIDRFALTSNNITYGAFGEGMSYWSFFPTGDAATGCIPVWGFANVTESRCDGIPVGERVYGYYPMADEVVLHPVAVDAHRFIDGAPHRRELHGLYNQYVRCAADPLYRPGDEDVLALYRPLFTTSFLIDDFLADNAFFGAAEVLVSSASSKTAYGLGYCLGARRAAGGGVPSIGLTSKGNLAFTTDLGCWDEVVAYEDVTRLSADIGVVYVDMSGDAALRTTIHAHWQDRLAYSCSVGGTHWEGLGSGKGLAGPRPVLFFAPAQIKKRVAEWGATGFQERLAAAWSAFLARAGDPAKPWLQVVVGNGREAVESTYTALLDGRVPANEGRILAV